MSQRSSAEHSAAGGPGSIPPFISPGRKQQSPAAPSATKDKELQFVTADPLLLSFASSAAENSYCKRTLTLTNTSQHRVAWRLRTNAPTRYVVAPANGFLTPTESVVVTVDLTDISKYNRRHRFMVQVMEAKEEEKDRKKVWNCERAGNLKFLQCIRVFTEGPELVTSTGNGLSSPANPPSTTTTTESSTRSYSSSGGSSGSSSSASSGGSTCSSTSASSGSASSSSSAYSTTTSSSAASSSSLGSADTTERVNDLTMKIRVAMDEKENVSQKMITVVNEVKMIEVELDRAGAVCKDLNSRLTHCQDQTKELEAKCVELESQLKPLKEAK